VTYNRQTRYWRAKVKIDLTLRARVRVVVVVRSACGTAAFHHFAAPLAQGIAEV
jgi:hypothetical protein